MFLEISELKRLTGAKQKRKMIEWLILNQYPHTIGLDGWPVVMIELVRQRLGIQVELRSTTLAGSGPNLEGLDLGKKAKAEQRAP